VWVTPANLRRQLDNRTVSGRAVRVVIVGRPNAGKSSLFNALLGRPAALVSGQPGTTRDYLTAEAEFGGMRAELVDTAGWEHAADTTAEQAQRLGRDQARRADVVVWCTPAGEPFDPAEEARFRDLGGTLLKVGTKADMRHETRETSEDVSRVSCLVSILTPNGTAALRAELADVLGSLSRPPLAPSQSRCRHHVEAAVQALQRAHHHALFDDPAELLALSLREALDQVGEMAGAVYTNDLLDRIFSRFCIGK
jgi:tRNA modification GTPase